MMVFKIYFWDIETEKDSQVTIDYKQRRIRFIRKKTKELLFDFSALEWEYRKVSHIQYKIFCMKTNASETFTFLSDGNKIFENTSKGFVFT